MATDRMSLFSASKPEPEVERWQLAKLVTTLALIGLIGLAIAVIGLAAADARPDATNDVFNALLPLLGTWVGTVLAFYFSRENFKSAQESVRHLAERLTPQERLRRVPVAEA